MTFSDYLSLLSSKAGCAIQVEKACIDLQNNELLKNVLMSVLVHMKIPIYPPIPPSVFLCREFILTLLLMNFEWLLQTSVCLKSSLRPSVCKWPFVFIVWISSSIARIFRTSDAMLVSCVGYGIYKKKAKCVMLWIKKIKKIF